jgi:hypothetical protein
MRPATLAAGLLSLAVAGAAVGVSAGAFTDQGAVGGNTFLLDTLAPPTGLTASVVGASIRLGWTATVDTYASGHRVFRGASSGGPYTQIDEVTPRTSTTYTDSPGTGAYYYVVRAFYQNWRSVDSNEASATVVVFAQDSFTDGTGTGLASHIPEVGGGWTAIDDSGTALIDASTEKSLSSSQILWRVNATPADNSYAVSLDVRTGSSVSGRCAGPAARLSDVNNCYRARLCGNGVVTLEKVVAETVTSLGTYTVPGFSTSTYYTIKLEVTDASKKVFFNGTQRISSADNSITATGGAGLRHEGGSTMRGDNFLAEQIP